MSLAQALTWNRHISFQLFALGIGKEQHHPLVVLRAQNAHVLTDALLTPSFRFGLGNCRDEDQLRSQQHLLETHAICRP